MSTHLVRAVGGASGQLLLHALAQRLVLAHVLARHARVLAWKHQEMCVRHTAACSEGCKPEPVLLGCGCSHAHAGMCCSGAQHTLKLHPLVAAARERHRWCDGKFDGQGHTVA